MGPRTFSSCRSFSSSACCSTRTPFLTSSMRVVEGITFFGRSLIEASNTCSGIPSQLLLLDHWDRHLVPALLRLLRQGFLRLLFFVRSAQCCQTIVPGAHLGNKLQSRKP